jgi:hypothetical protein
MSDRCTPEELQRINVAAQTIDLTVTVPPPAIEDTPGTNLIVLGGFGLTRAVFQNWENWLK